MQLGASLSVADIGTGPIVLRDYAQAAEGLDLMTSGGRSRAGQQPNRHAAAQR